ncbi:MAG: hypothetical protein IKL13_06040 [Clostridia bacterium]|nr:hypothetical protein [Clostridia bacterium]
MKRRQKSQLNKWVWLAVLLLFVCVAATTIAFMSRLSPYLPSDSGAIDLLDTERLADAGAPAPTATTIGGGTTAATAPPRPGMEVGDEQTVWTTDTQVEIFRIHYENGEQEITVQSQDGSKVIAPGTENNYVFKLKNTGNVTLDYTVEIDAYCAPAAYAIPVEARLTRYDGAAIVGDADGYGTVAQLDAAQDAASLGAGKYTYYTLEWCWPFEGDDEWDTLLGNLAAEEELTFSIAIRTTATHGDGPGGGIDSPSTGDRAMPYVWLTLSVCALAFLVMLLILRHRTDDEEAA